MICFKYLDKYSLQLVLNFLDNMAQAVDTIKINIENMVHIKSVNRISLNI